MHLRERLLKLLHVDMSGCEGDYAEEMADYLSNNHVVPFPCGPGDTIYDIYEFVRETPFPNPTMEKWEVKCIGFQADRKGKLFYNIDGRVIPPEEFGKTIFLSEAEALRAIERGGQNNVCNTK